jgi:hypothetical protein
MRDSEEDAGQKRSRAVKSEVIPEDKSLVNVLYICEMNEMKGSEEDAGQKRPRTVKSEVIPEEKSLVNVLYICEVNNCGYNCEYFKRIAIKFGVRK